MNIEEHRTKKKKKTWQEQFVKKHYNKLLYQAIFPHIIPFIIIHIQTIIWPGPIYCGDSSCPRSSNQPAIPDVAMLIIGLSIYVYSSFWCFCILFSSGSWMPHAFWRKILVYVSLLLMGCSVFQLIPAAAYREFVAPYYAVQPYTFHIAENGSPSNVTHTISNIWNPLYDNLGNPVLIQVTEASGKEGSIDDLSPFATVVYRDQSYDSTTPLANGTQTVRQIGELQGGQWYMFAAVPAHKGVNGNAYESRSLIKVHPALSLFGKTVSALDLRAFKLCQWNQMGFCEHGIH